MLNLKILSFISQAKNYEYLYGINPIMASLYANKRKFTTLYINQSQQDNYINPRISNIIGRANEIKLETLFIPKVKLKNICGSENHQNIVMKCSKFSYCENVPENEDLILLDSVQDPQNFGAILRVCFFLGINTVIVESKGQCPLSPTVSKTSAGALEMMNIVESEDIIAFIKQRRSKYQIIGSGFESNSIPIEDFSTDKKKQNKIIIFGSEGFGIRQDLLKQCDTIVNIMSCRSQFPETLVDSLNVSVSAGIILQKILSNSN